MNTNLPPGTLQRDIEPEVAEDGLCTRCGGLLMAEEHDICLECWGKEYYREEANEKENPN